MLINKLYNHKTGRAFIIALQKCRLFHVANLFLKTKFSRLIIPHYIKKYQINMKDFENQKFRSFADFFARTRKVKLLPTKKEALISPCDGLISIYKISDKTNLKMKRSYYRIKDIISDDQIAMQFKDGGCIIFRLRAFDYHHFCAFDDLNIIKTCYIPGTLHSVQPIACEKTPVYRLNKRWWSLLNTENFGTVVQVEIGAMLVGDVHFNKIVGPLNKGDDMGNFELAGSTIVLFITKEIMDKIKLKAAFLETYNGLTEKEIHMGEEIAELIK